MDGKKPLFLLMVGRSAMILLFIFFLPARAWLASVGLLYLGLAALPTWVWAMMRWLPLPFGATNMLPITSMPIEATP